MIQLVIEAGKISATEMVDRTNVQTRCSVFDPEISGFAESMMSTVV